MNKEKPLRNGLLLGAMGLLVVACICSISLAYLFFNTRNSSPIILTPVNFSEPTAPLPTTSLPTVQATKDLSNYYDTAYALTLQENCVDAIGYRDLVIAEMPQNGTAYYYRAKCHFKRTTHQNIKSEYERDIFQALEDIDKAIAYGVESEQPGDPYYLRYQIYDGFAGILESRPDLDNVRRLGLQNLRAATIQGTSEKHAAQWIPLALFSLGQCQDGMEEIKQLKENYGLSAPPSASMLNIEAHGYLCLGELDKALEYVDRGLTIEFVPERAWLRSIILYRIGRNDEALEELNGLIEAQPQYNGYRYYLRGLILHEKGERELAESDLMIGSGNTWAQQGLRAYVLGQMALDDGDKEAAAYHLEQALASLDWYYDPMLSQIERQLGALGVQPVLAESQFPAFLQATPLPTLNPAPIADQSVPTSSFGFPLPPNLRPIDMVSGTGQSQVGGNVYPYPVYLFQTQKSVVLNSVQNMTIHLEPYSNQEPAKFEVFIWELKTGEWVMFKPGWGSAAIDRPERFVDSNGDVYVAIRWEADNPFMIQNIWLNIEATGTDGSLIVLGLNK